MKVFVTGGSGFVGSAVVRCLANMGHEVTGLVHRRSNIPVVELAGGTAVVGDLLKPSDQWVQALRESEFVISATQPVRTGERVSLAEARRRSYNHGQMVGNLFLTSEGSKVKCVAVTYGVQGFGNHGDQWITEETDLNPSGYERTVSGAYWHVEKTSRKVRVPLINLFTGWVYGPGSWFEATVKCLTNGVARIVGDGSNYLSLIHIDDLAMAYAMLVEKMPLGERYCLVDDNPITQAELAFYIASLAGTRKPKKVDLENYCRIAGDLAGESQSCSTRVSGTKMSKRLLPVLKFPDYRTGIPDALDRLSDGPGRERAA